MNSTAVWQWNGMVHGSKSLAVMSVATIESCMTAEYTDGTQCSALRCEGALGYILLLWPILAISKIVTDYRGIARPV